MARTRAGVGVRVRDRVRREGLISTHTCITVALSGMRFSKDGQRIRVMVMVMGRVRVMW